MDFTLSEEQQAIADLAARIFADQATPERVKEVEGGTDRIDRALYEAVAETPTPLLDRVMGRLSRAADHSKLSVHQADIRLLAFRPETDAAGDFLR